MLGITNSSKLLSNKNKPINIKPVRLLKNWVSSFLKMGIIYNSKDKYVKGTIIVFGNTGS